MTLTQRDQPCVKGFCEQRQEVAKLVHSRSQNAELEFPGIQYRAHGVTELLTIPPRQQPQQTINQDFDRRADRRIAADLQFDKLETLFLLVGIRGRPHTS